MSMTTLEMVENTLKAIKKYSLINPWENYNPMQYILSVDQQKIDSFEIPIIQDKIMWKSTDKYKFEDQFPVPVNGNFLKAKYLLLYSNPGTEENDLNKSSVLNSNLSVKESLIRCFNLDLNSKLVIPSNNPQWEKWYIGELDKFFTHPKVDIANFNIHTFLDDFCFINLLAYPTISNEFDFTKDELKQLHDLPSTKFAKELVKIGMEAKKEIIVIRRSEGVWKHSADDTYLFDKLSSHYQKATKSNLL